MVFENRREPVFFQIDPTVPLVRVRGARAVLVHVCGSIESYFMHWCPTLLRTQPCLRVECPYCAQRLPKRPLSYAGILHWRICGGDLSWTRAILEVPFRTGLQLAELQARVVSLRRQGPNGRVVIEPSTVRVQPPATQAFSPIEKLRCLWRLPRDQQCSLVSDDIK